MIVAAGHARVLHCTLSRTDYCITCGWPWLASVDLIANPRSTTEKSEPTSSLAIIRAWFESKLLVQLVPESPRSLTSPQDDRFCSCFGLEISKQGIGQRMRLVFVSYKCAMITDIFKAYYYYCSNTLKVYPGGLKTNSHRWTQLWISLINIVNVNIDIQWHTIMLNLFHCPSTSLD